MQRNKHKALLSRMPSNKFLLKALVIFSGITAVVFLYYVPNTKVMDKSRGMAITNPSDTSWHKANNQLNSFQSKEEVVGNSRKLFKKIFIAFGYWEQLTAATNNFLDLTALASYGGREVVVPFVKDSFFYGTPRAEKKFETLELYYNVSALNHTLRSRGHGTLVSWKEFQDVCKGKLDVLLHFDYTNLNKTIKYNQASRAFFPCKKRHSNSFRDLTVKRKICMNVFAVDSVEKFENEVIEKLPCVGFDEWRGSNIKYSHRAQFQLSSVVANRLHLGEAGIFFSSKLLHVAQDFITKTFGPHFISMHIRAERILKLAKTIRDMAAVIECISNLTARVQRHRNNSTAPVFLASDFAEYGSLSRRARQARQSFKSLMKILAPLKPVIFQPSVYNLTDRGTVAIVEMNILVSGKHLFVVGGGTFQEWVVSQFLHKNNIDSRHRAKCQSDLCNVLCWF